MEKDVCRIKKNEETEIVVRLDDFGGQPGLTIREFVTSQNYTGFTRAGVRIKAEKFEDFKTAINSIDPQDLQSQVTPYAQQEPKQTDSDESGIDEQGLM